MTVTEHSVACDGSALSNSTEELILAHRDTGRKFGRMVLRKWGAQMSDDEFESAVDLAICEAARSFSPTQGASFSTFLFYYVRGTLIRVIKSSVSARRVAKAAFLSAAGSNLSVIDLEEQGIDETPLKDIEAVDVREYESPEEQALRQESIRLVRESLDKLGENERKVLISLFHEGKSPNQMMREFGWSRQLIARVKNEGIRQLKEILEARHDHAQQTPAPSTKPPVAPKLDRRAKAVARRRRLATLRSQVKPTELPRCRVA